MINYFLLYWFPACGQLQKRIEEVVLDSFGDQFYEKAMQCVKCLREQCVKVGVPSFISLL